MPEMLRTIMSDLLSQEPDMVIAGGSGRPEDSLPNAREQHADVLVTQDGQKVFNNVRHHSSPQERDDFYRSWDWRTLRMKVGKFS